MAMCLTAFILTQAPIVCRLSSVVRPSSINHRTTTNNGNYIKPSIARSIHTRTRLGLPLGLRLRRTQTTDPLYQHATRYSPGLSCLTGSIFLNPGTINLPCLDITTRIPLEPETLALTINHATAGSSGAQPSCPPYPYPYRPYPGTT